MNPTTANVLLFAFHDPPRAPQIVAAARVQTGVRSVALVGRSADREIRIVGGVGEPITEAKWLASALAVLDKMSGPLGVLAGAAPEADPVTLPDSDAGLATFGRLVPPGALAILVAVCDEESPLLGSFDRQLGAALFQLPPRGPRGTPACVRAARDTARDTAGLGHRVLSR